jgi:hypothetical protein
MLPLEFIAISGLLFAFVLFAMVRHAYGVARTQGRADHRVDYQEEAQG